MSRVNNQLHITKITEILYKGTLYKMGLQVDELEATEYELYQLADTYFGARNWIKIEEKIENEEGSNI